MPGIRQLKDELEAAFPDTPYTGEVTHADGEPFSEEIDDDLALFRYLSGRDWKSIEPSFVDFQYASLPLLTDAAFVAFLPAWLLRALDPQRTEAPVRAHLVFTLAAGLRKGGEDRLKLLNERQRNVVMIVLTHILGTEHGERVRSDIEALQEYLRSEA